MSEVTDLTVLEIKPEQAPVLYVANGLDQYLELIRQMANEVPDLTTAKGRARVASLSAQVSRSKTLIEKPGREYLKHLKEAVKPAEAELRRFVTECDNLRDEVRRPLTDWEAEQDRIKAEEEARIAAEAYSKMRDEADRMNEDFNIAAAKKLAERIESDHEIGLLLNDKFDRDAAEKKAEAERQRVAHEQEIARQAAEQARKEAEEAQRIEREAAARREADLRAQAEQAERDRISAQERAEREAREALERTALLAQQAREQAEREKQEAIAAERLRAEQVEAARLAEEKRIADEAAERAANETHRKQIGTAVVNALMSNAGLTREQALATLVALKDNRIPHASITY